MKKTTTKFLLIFCAVILSGLPLVRALAEPPPSDDGFPHWSHPPATAIIRASPLPSSQNEPNFLNNLNCDIATYRLSSGSDSQAGCFTSSAIGWMDSDAETAIFNGTDEGLPLISYSPHQVLVPWPGTLDMLALDPVLTGGSYISLYRNLLSNLQDVRDIFGQLTAKRLTAPAELPMTGADGSRLIINPQTLSFSSSGSWLVVEGLSGKFIRINLATLEERPFAPAYGSSGSPALLKSRVAVSDNGRYVAIENDIAESFKVYDLSNCLESFCPAYDFWAFIHQQIPEIRFIRHVRFLNDGIVSFEVVSANPDHSGTYEIAPREKISSLIDYLALGDSYTSGEGAFDYRAGTDTTDNACHLSINSYPQLLTRDLFSPAGGHSVACSGATIEDLANTGSAYRGQVRNGSSYSELLNGQTAILPSIETNFLPGYIAQHRFVNMYQPAALTVSIGGNDIGFGDMLVSCVMPHIKIHASDNVCFETYEDRLEVLNLIRRNEPRWTALYKQLLSAAPNTRLYAIGYPDIVSDTGKCGLNVHLNKSELEFAKELVDKLNESIRRAATKANVQYVDISHALEGHRLCEAASYNVAVNGLTAGRDGGPFGLKIIGSESYHPNALGHRLIEQVILAATDNLRATFQSQTVSSSDEKFITKPRTGRAVRSRVPANVTSAVARRNSVISVWVKSGLGLRASHAYSVRLDGTEIATGQSDQLGNLTVSLAIPPSTDIGGHTLDIIGDSIGQDELDITQPVYVEGEESDSDGDSVDDSTDSCRLVVNSGFDFDQDGIDDGCDGYIGTAGEQAGGGPDLTTGSGQDGPLYDSPKAPSSVGLVLKQPPLAQIKIKGSAARNVLGDRTVNPQVSRGVRLLAPGHPQPRIDPWRARLLPALKLLVISWLLLLFIAYLFRRLTGNRSVLA